MAKERPDHHDAELALRVYDMRREAVMRESRAAINQKFWPKTYDDVVALTKGDHPLNAAYRQVGSFWEMVYGFARHGIVHPDFWLESNGEGMFVFAKAAPYLERIRAEISPVAFRNAEWVSKECAEGRRLFAMFRDRVAKALASK
jgi:hypothetical protein